MSRPTGQSNDSGIETFLETMSPFLLTVTSITITAMLHHSLKRGPSPSLRRRTSTCARLTVALVTGIPRREG